MTLVVYETYGAAFQNESPVGSKRNRTLPGRVRTGVLSRVELGCAARARPFPRPFPFVFCFPDSDDVGGGGGSMDSPCGTCRPLRPSSWASYC